MANEKKHMHEEKQGDAKKSNVRISFSSAGKDFHLEVRGDGLDECEKAFERLFERVRTTAQRTSEGPQYR